MWHFKHFLGDQRREPFSTRRPHRSALGRLSKHSLPSRPVTCRSQQDSHFGRRTWYRTLAKTIDDTQLSYPTKWYKRQAAAEDVSRVPHKILTERDADRSLGRQSMQTLLAFHTVTVSPRNLIKRSRLFFSLARPGYSRGGRARKMKRKKYIFGAQVGWSFSNFHLVAMNEPSLTTFSGLGEVTLRPRRP